MRRRRGGIRRAVTAAPRAISFLSWQKRYGRKDRWGRNSADAQKRYFDSACRSPIVRSARNALRAAAQLGFPSAQHAIQIVLFAPVEYLTYGSRKNVLFARTAVHIAHKQTAVQITAETAAEYFDDLAGLSNTQLYRVLQIRNMLPHKPSPGENPRKGAAAPFLVVLRGIVKGENRNSPLTGFLFTASGLFL